MKSLMPNKPNSQNGPKRPEFEGELRFEGGITRQQLSGVKRLTIRFGKRKFKPNITVRGDNPAMVRYPAVVEGVKHTTLLHMDFETLRYQGFKNMFSTLMILRRFYPEINMNSEITVVEYRVLPY